MKNEQLIGTSFIIVTILASSVLPTTQVASYNLLQNGLLSSATASYVKPISNRSVRVQAIRGKYAFVPTSSEEFALRKKKEIEQGLA